MTEQSALSCDEESPGGRGPMPAVDDFERAPEKALFARLDQLQLPYTTTLHAPVMTVAASHDVKALVPGGGHTKNLFMRDKRGQLVLVSAWQESQLPLNHLHREIGTQRLSFSDAPLLWEALGVTPGSVTGFALINDPMREGAAGRVKFIADAALLAFDTLNFHPLRNDMTTSIATRDFLAFAAATGHTVQRVDFARLASS